MDDADGSGGGAEGEARGGNSDGISLPEAAVMVASASFTVALFAFAVWQSFVGPAAVTPQVTVIDSAPSADSDVAYTVELVNPGDLGLVSTTVEADCTDPPVSLTFENVPASGRRVGTVVCPPGTDPNVSVTSWIRE